MKLKEIWQFIKSVAWPFAKEKFICANLEEAKEMVVWARNHERIANAAENYMSLDRDNLPVLVIKCMNFVDDETE